jgi:hypothetical protein
MKTIEDLKVIGFKKAGYWVLTGNKIESYINDEFLQLEDILYSFESEGIIKYIGITEQSLKARMINYKSGHDENKCSGTTNKLVNHNIKSLLINKKEVSIYFLKGEASCDYFDFKISLSTGIEKSLIKIFDINDNLWNKRGVKSPKSNNENKNNSKIKSININDNQTIVKLRNEAFNKGVILFNKKIDDLLPIESEGMDIHFNNKPISGWFTRSQKNKKVNGYKELKEIINSNFKFGDEILVTILNPNEMKIEKYSKK